ncbi:MAG: sigma-54-dependent Fis family transcriptional regulator [Candidatus Latescibacteria bacterium]|jgi:DNA-binding NtrC family response regulator|nr:sigma-54-dependent Fis family transcriptional regulator [Candidatus Latescibacterota bacterium]
MERSKYPYKPILLVDDEKQFLFSVTFALNSAGINNIVECDDSRRVLDLLAEHSFSVIVLDLNMPHISGFELLPEIKQEYPYIPVTVLTAVTEIETAVECMKNGAFDYLVKPLDNNQLLTHIRRSIDHAEMQAENLLLKEYLLTDELKHPKAFKMIITRNKAMKSIFKYVESIAGTSLPVLITGETGVGKELFAMAIHTVSGRRGNFVTENVAGVDDTLFSDTLFGHKRGAFTGADRDRKGLIEEASGGTLFLDEIGDLCIESQVKLLRLLQEHTYYQLGSDKPKSSDARIVVATNKDLKSVLESGAFRKDLYYRLYAHHIKIPPLRDRKEDIPLLLEHLLQKTANEIGKKKPTAPRELLMLLNTYNFPGNVRELEGMIVDAVSRHESGILSTKSFREKIITDLQESETISNRQPFVEQLDFPEQLPTLKELETMFIEEAMRRADNNQTIAAQLLGISRNTLNSRLRRSHS